MKGFQKALQKKGIDLALLFADDPNIFYFCQMPCLNFSVLAVPADDEPVLMVPKMDYDRAKVESRLKNVVCFEKKKLISEFVSQYLKKSKIKAGSIGINKSHLTLLTFSRFKKNIKGRFKDISEDLSYARSVKDESEIARIKKACSIADNALQSVLSSFKFRTETEVEAALDFYAKEEGADNSFKTIVASGKNSSYPHHTTKHEKLRKGFCIIDYGVKYKGYCSDMTRTIYLGTPSAKEKEMYNKVLSLQEKTMLGINPGDICGDVDLKAREMFGRYKENFTHGLGHGVGVEIHESPSFSIGSKDILKSSMVFTIEPGIYFPGRFGIRIEDTVLLRDKALPMSTTRKDLVNIRP